MPTRSVHDDGKTGDSAGEPLAAGLGWFSLALGAAELAAPGSVAQLIGIPDNDRTRPILRAFGAREVASGIGILQAPSDPKWMWSRVAGDVMDLGALLSQVADDRTDRGRLARALAAVGGALAADVYTAQQLSKDDELRRRKGLPPRAEEEKVVHVSRAVTINRQPEAVYQFWRRLDNLPRFMRHLKSVEILDAKRSRWKARAPAGMTVQWEAEITDERPNEQISWRSLEGSRVRNRGTVRFERAPGARGTEVRVDLEYVAPGGRVGMLLAKTFGREPGQQVKEDLRRLKQLLETGEIARSAGSTRFRQPAQPLPGERAAAAVPRGASR